MNYCIRMLLPLFMAKLLFAADLEPQTGAPPAKPDSASTRPCSSPEKERYVVASKAAMSLSLSDGPEVFSFNCFTQLRGLGGRITPVDSLIERDHEHVCILVGTLSHVPFLFLRDNSCLVASENSPGQWIAYNKSAIHFDLAQHDNHLRFTDSVSLDGTPNQLRFDLPSLIPALSVDKTFVEGPESRMKFHIPFQDMNVEVLVQHDFQNDFVTGVQYWRLDNRLVSIRGISIKELTLPGIAKVSFDDLRNAGFFKEFGKSGDSNEISLVPPAWIDDEKQNDSARKLLKMLLAADGPTTQMVKRKF